MDADPARARQAPGLMMTADEMLRCVENTLAPLVATALGTLDVASSPDHAIELLTTAPPKWRLILGWPGYGGHPDAVLGMGSHRIYAIIQGPAGLPARAGDVLHKQGPAGAPPLMARIETVSMWFRAMRFPDGCGVDSKGWALEGTNWLEVEGLETKQHQLDFTLAAALPALAQVLRVSLDPATDSATSH